MTKHKHKVNEFLKEAAQFQLGDLPTESSHPKTTRLSILAQTDLISAIRIFQEVEIEALEGLLNHTAQIDELKSSIEACLQNHGRIFFCGCGATGRLSLSLETNWRESLSDSHRALSESVFPRFVVPTANTIRGFPNAQQSCCGSPHRLALAIHGLLRSGCPRRRSIQ